MLIFSSIDIYFNFNGAKIFEAEGTVIKAQWNTRNHDMSLFLIETNTGTKKLYYYNVILKPNEIKVGDDFKKQSGSKSCLINNVLVRCIK